MCLLEGFFSVYITNFLSMLLEGANVMLSVRVEMSHICTVLIVKLLSTVESRSGWVGEVNEMKKADGKLDSLGEVHFTFSVSNEHRNC